MKAAIALLVIVLTSAGCESVRITSPCEDRDPAGEHAVLIESRISMLDPLRVGDTVTLRASVRPVLYYVLNTSFGGCIPSLGDPVPATVSWSSRDITIVTVNAAGLVQARRAGTASVVARDEARNIEGEWELWVLP